MIWCNFFLSSLSVMEKLLAVILTTASLQVAWYVTHSPKHWSNQEMIQEIIVPYIEKVREDIGDNKRALMINNFKS